MDTEARDASTAPPAGDPHGTTAAIDAFRNNWRFVQRHRGEKRAAFPTRMTVLLVVAAFIPSTRAASAAEYLVTSRIESSSGSILVPAISVGARCEVPASWCAAPVPKQADPGEGRIVLWRDGCPVAVAPGTKDVSPLGGEFEGRPGRLRVGPDGKRLLVYVANRDDVLPSAPAKRDRVFVRDGRTSTEIDTGVSPCHAFWGADGTIYGHGLVPPKGEVPDPAVDLTKAIVNWSFDPRTGKANRLKLPGDVAVLDVSHDGKSFLVLQYEKVPGAPGLWPDYRLGVLPAAGGQLVPLTKLGDTEWC